MPMYDFNCPTCQLNFTVLRKLADFSRTQEHTCGTIGNLVISKPMIAPDYPDYISPATNRLISGKQAHKEDLARSGCRILEPGEFANHEKKLAQVEQVQERRLESLVTQTYQQLYQ